MFDLGSVEWYKSTPLGQPEFLESAKYEQRKRNRIYDKTHGLCAYCGQRAATTLDHVVPVSKGGTNHIDNLLGSCGTCNRSKENVSLEEFREWFFSVPNRRRLEPKFYFERI
jgi:5-methylcytosine-specific restriction endonuclease McrA